MPYLESFIIAAVASLLAIRWFLALTGFPRVGEGGLHIAHMLWGGALMLTALLLLFAYLDRPIQHVAAIVAGLGFGTFIDEIGKFVTADSNYFFRPAVALIYVVMVMVFIVGRTLIGRRTLTQREALANALDLMQVRLVGPLEGDDRARIDDLLLQADPNSELVAALHRYLEGLPETPDVNAWWESVPRWFAALYKRAASDPRFSRALTGAVIVYAAAAVTASLIVVVTAQRTGTGLSVAAIGQIVSTLVGAGLIGIGVLALPQSRVDAYRWFLRGILVWLLITQVFIFYSSQFAGLGGLAIDLGAYVMVRYALGHESGSRGSSPASAAD
jgi:hypothetical protein